jgi:hypothetical protein
LHILASQYFQCAFSKRSVQIGFKGRFPQRCLRAGHCQYASQPPGKLPPRAVDFISHPSYGSLSRKKLAFCKALIGMAVEKPPVAFSAPVLFVVQVIGTDRLVVLSKV